MTVAQIDLDDDELEQAVRYLGTSTKTETVNIALRELNARRRRLVALDSMAQRYERGEFEAAVEAWEERKGIGRNPAESAA